MQGAGGALFSRAHRAAPLIVSDYSNSHVFVRSLAPSSCLGRLGLDETVDDRIEEDTGNPDAAPQQFHEVKGLAENDGHAHDDDHALGRVGHGLSHGVLRR
jgi:hypothetical protein